MRTSLRLGGSLLLLIAGLAGASAYLQARHERARQTDELERRCRLLGESLSESLEPLLERGRAKDLDRLVEKFGNRERLAGLALYDSQQTALAMTQSLASLLPTAPHAAQQALQSAAEASEFETIAGRGFHLFAQPLPLKDGTTGTLVILHDSAYIETRLSRLLRQTFWRHFLQMLLLALVILAAVRWTLARPVRRLALWMKQLRAGEAPGPLPLPHGGLFAPLAHEATTFAKHLNEARSAAEEEARLRQAAESRWTAERLKEHVKTKLQGRPLFVVSNREPYMHRRNGRQVEVIVPAGGLVTALDPLLRACGGLWVAHGAGDADWVDLDGRNRLRVPPEDPSYTLKRVPLTKEEEDGYYYGFSNEGLWPLCHIVHTRPTFRAEDFEHYRRANAKFAEAVLEELEGVEEPCVLIQDYHFALLPRLLKEKRPDARIALFWHIPWPNPEAFGICPWQRELLAGMLGADLIGFQTQFYCNNFLDTIDRALETRIDREGFSVHREGHRTSVKAFPISVAPTAAAKARPDRAALLRELGVEASHVAVGVDRVDYTKGLLERFRAVEAFLEAHPAYQGRFTLVQLGAPSRTHIKRYHDFQAEVEAEVERINWRFKTKTWRPIVLLLKHHDHDEILPYYRMADLCLVTSLHDGMNLVAKEFVACRDDEDGVLVLSRFAGASRELRDALLVNPYDVGQTAEAIRLALEMPATERTARMVKLRETVRENNVYRWAGSLLTELVQVRLKEPSRRS